MGNSEKTVAEQRNYSVLSVEDARQITGVWLEDMGLEDTIGLGLPEVDDRYHIWRVPLLAETQQERIGEVVIDAHTSLVTVGLAAAKSERRFVLIEKNPEYTDEICNRARMWLGKEAVEDVFLINCSPIYGEDTV